MVCPPVLKVYTSTTPTAPTVSPAIRVALSTDPEMEGIPSHRHTNIFPSRTLLSSTDGSAQSKSRLRTALGGRFARWASVESTKGYRPGPGVEAATNRKELSGCYVSSHTKHSTLPWPLLSLYRSNMRERLFTSVHNLYVSVLSTK